MIIITQNTWMVRKADFLNEKITKIARTRQKLKSTTGVAQATARILFNF